MPIYRRKDTGTLEFRKTIRGVKYYQSLPEARTKLEAQVAEAQILRQIYEGRYGREGGEIGSYDFTRFVDEIYLPHAKGHLRQYKDVTYKCGVLKTYFRGKRLRDITQIEVEKFRRARLSAGLKPVTVRGNIAMLSIVLNFAIDNDYLGANPCRKVRWKRGEVVANRSRIASPEEIERLMPELEADRETRAAVVLALNCGLRKMGVLSLTKDDVDFKARTLRYVSKGGRRKIVPVNADALEVLRELVSRAYPSGRLFADEYGFSLSFEKGAFKRACKRAGIVGLNFHDLRRSFAERIDKMWGPTTARDLLGHTTVQVTSEHYLPENFEAMRRAVDALSGNILNGNFTGKGAKRLKRA